MDKRIVNDDIKSKNIESKECLILYADIMGFKNMVYNLTHDELKERLENFTSCCKNRISPLLKGGYLKSVQFSDSIIMIVDGIEKKDVQPNIKSCDLSDSRSYESKISYKRSYCTRNFFV